MRPIDRTRDHRYLLQTTAKLAKQRADLQRLREAVEVAKASTCSKVRPNRTRPSPASVAAADRSIREQRLEARPVF
jgi:hypothetical protein